MYLFWKSWDLTLIGSPENRTLLCSKLLGAASCSHWSEASRMMLGRRPTFALSFFLIGF